MCHLIPRNSLRGEGHPYAEHRSMGKVVPDLTAVPFNRPLDLQSGLVEIITCFYNESTGLLLASAF